MSKNNPKNPKQTPSEKPGSSQRGEVKGSQVPVSRNPPPPPRTKK